MTGTLEELVKGQKKADGKKKEQGAGVTSSKARAVVM